MYVSMLGSLLGPLAGRAQAAPFTASLDYDGGAGCPDPEDFNALVSARLGYDPFVGDAPDHVIVRITPRAGAIEGHIEWRDSAGAWAGDQSLPVASNDCRHLVRALAAALAVQIQLLATRTGHSAGSASARTTAPAPEAPAPQPVPHGPGPVFAMGAGTALGFGMSSRPVLLGRVLGSVDWRHVSVELAGEASLPATTRRSDGAGFSQRHLLASAAACAVLARWRACLLANAGEVRMTGEDIDRPRSAVVPLVEAGFRIGIVQPLGRHFFVGAHADGLANVIRWTATLDQVPVWTAPRLGAVLGIGLGAHVP